MMRVVQESAVQQLIWKHDRELLNHPDVQSAVVEVQGIIRERYPEARFHVGIGHDPLGVYMTATVDVEDTDDVDDLYFGRMVDIQVEERVPLYVSTESPHDRWTNDAHASEMAGTLAGDRWLES